MTNWGSVQYEGAHKTFYRLLHMDREEALAELNIKELPKVSPDTLVEYTSYDDISDEESTKKIPIRQFFAATKDEAWDLWEASDSACQVFGELFSVHELKEYDITGQECFLLWISGAFEGEDADEVFGGFCT